MKKILFVDDDINLLKANQRRLRKSFEVDIAQDGESGLAAITSQGPYGVIVADLMMPTMNGFEFLEKARLIAPDTVFIMLTGHGNLEVSMKALNEGDIFQFLTKPCKMHVMEKAIQAAIEQYKKNRQISRISQDEGLEQLRRKILIVDDDAEALSIMSAAFKAADQFDVLCAENGQVALAIMNLLKIDTVIVDWEMPEMDGNALVASIRQTHPDIDCYLMTWRPTVELEATVLESGAAGCFEKPLSLDHVLKTIRDTLHRSPRGRIDGISTAALLQMIEMEEKTCTVHVQSGDQLGLLFFQKGRLIGAETNSLQNEAAAYEIINWSDTAIELENIGRKKKIGINQPLMQILMQAAKIQDEANGSP